MTTDTVKLLKDCLFHIGRDIGTRPIGSAGNRLTRQYLIDRVSSLGAPVALQPFEKHYSYCESCVVTVRESPSRLLDSWPAFGSKGTNDLSGMAIDCGLGGRLEIPELVRNNVGLVKRGGIHEEAKVNNLAEAGALGALLYVDYQNALYSARVSKAVSPIPVAIIRANDATSLLTLDLAARPMVSLAIDASPIRAECANVIIDFAKGESRHTVVCAHYDSRPSTPGANDNAAGVACVLAVVEKFIANKMPTPVRFVFFDGEELGLIGSKTYASSGWSNGCDKVINVDAVGGGRLAVLTRDRDNPLDSSLVESALQVAHKLQIRLKTAESRTGTSDHAPLMARGVRAVWLSDHPNIGRETDIDVVESIDLSELPATTELVWALLNE